LDLRLRSLLRVGVSEKPNPGEKKNLSKHARILAGLGEFHAVRRKSCNGADRRSSGSQKSKLKRDAIVLAEQIKASRLRLAFFLQPMPLTYNPSSSWKFLTVTFVCVSARLGFCLVAAWPGLPAICCGSDLLVAPYPTF